MTCPPSATNCLPVPGWDEGQLYIPDLTTPTGQQIMSRFQSLVTSPLSDNRFAICYPAAGSPSQEEITWKAEFTAFMQMFFGTSIFLDDRCGIIDGDSDYVKAGATPDYATFGESIAALTRGVDCSGGCCALDFFQNATGNLEQCAASILFPTQYAPPSNTSQFYCRDAMAGAIMGLAHQLTGTSLASTQVECYTEGYKPETMIQPVGFAPDGTGLTGPFTCSTPNSDNPDIAYAWNTTLNTVWRLWNRACNCPSSVPGSYTPGAGGAGVAMCSGAGVCNPGDAADNTTWKVQDTGQCVCGPGAKGSACSTVTPSSCPPCGDHGTCNTNTMYCVCDVGWAGLTCNIPECPSDASGNVCSGNGSCNNNVCVCNEGYSGVDCGTAFGPKPPTLIFIKPKTLMQRLKPFIPYIVAVLGLCIAGAIYFFILRTPVAPAAAQTSAASGVGWGDPVQASSIYA